MQTKNIKIKNHKNQNLALIINKPDEDGNFPLVVILHGFKGYKDEYHLKHLAEHLAENNYVAVRFDCSGFGDSEGTLQEDYRFSNYKKDLQKVFEHVITLPFVDQDRVGLCGHSLGAMLAIVYGAENNNIKAICSISPPDLVATKDALSKQMPKWKEKGYIEMDSSKMGGKIKIPYSFYLDVKDVDTTYYASKIDASKTPTLVILGKKDPTVLPEQSRNVAYSIKNGIPPLEIDEMDHVYKYDKEMTNYVTDQVFNFFKKNL